MNRVQLKPSSQDLITGEASSPVGDDQVYPKTDQRFEPRCGLNERGNSLLGAHHCILRGKYYQGSLGTELDSGASFAGVRGKHLKLTALACCVAD